LTGGASTPRANIARHSGIELVSTNNMVKMSGGVLAGLNDGIKTLNSKASKLSG
jgi:hypothetical protein